jgi:hypothetical protein
LNSHERLADLSPTWGSDEVGRIELTQYRVEIAWFAKLETEGRSRQDEPQPDLAADVVRKDRARENALKD